MENIRDIVIELLKKQPELLTLSKPNKKKFLDILSYHLFVDDFINEFDFEETLEEYLSNQKEEYKSAIQSCIQKFYYFLNYYEISISDVIFDTVYLYKISLEKNGKTKASIRVSMSRLSSFFDFLMDKYPQIFIFNYFKEIDVYENVSEENTSIIPSDNEIDYIINNVPPQIAAFIAILCVKGYSHTEAVNCTLEYTNDLSFEGDFAFAYLDYSEYNLDEWDPEDLSLSDFIVLYESNTPQWYKTVLTDYCLSLKFPVAEKPFTNINPRSFEKQLAKYMKQFVESGAITKPYTVKSFRWFAIKNMYEKKHDLSAIQKVLHHSTPSITKKYLMNMEIKVD